MICFYVIFPFLLKIFKNVLAIAGVLKHFGARDPFQGKKNSKDPPHIYNSY